MRHMQQNDSYCTRNHHLYFLIHALVFFHDQAVENESFCGTQALQWHQALNALQKLVTWYLQGLRSKEVSKCKYHPTGPKSCSCNTLGRSIFGKSKPGFPSKGLRQTPEVYRPRRGDVFLSRLSCSGVISKISISGFLLWTQEPQSPGRQVPTRVPGSLWVTAINPARMSPTLSSWQYNWISLILEAPGFWNIDFSEFLVHRIFWNCPSTAQILLQLFFSNMIQKSQSTSSILLVQFKPIPYSLSNSFLPENPKRVFLANAAFKPQAQPCFMDRSFRCK